MNALFSLTDLRQTLRRLSRERGFTVTVLLTLALCIGANVAIFAVVDAILLRSLPFERPSELVNVINSYPKAGVERAGASVANYYDRRGNIPAFSSVAIARESNAIIGEAGSPRRVPTYRISTDFFSTLGVPLAMGRTFTEEEMIPASSRVAILTDGFWRSQFNADPNVLGRTFQVDGFAITVVGVLPKGFRYLSTKPQFYLPAASDAKARAADNRHSNNYQFLARLAPGATLAVAQSQIDAFNEKQLTDEPYANLIKGAGYHTMLKSLHADHVNSVRPVLLLLQAGVLALLLIGGVNLINLLLIRASGRAKELAVRQALGASRRHVTREVMLETMILALGGGVLGLGAGFAGIQLLSALGTEQLPLGATVVFDLRVAAVALAVAILVGMALALPIIWFNLRGSLAPVLQAETRGGTVSKAAQQMRHGFIVAQVALAFVLLAGAGLLGVSLKRVLATAPGFRTEHVLTGKIVLPFKNYPKTPERLAFTERLLAELRAQPGVTSVGITSGLPFTGGVDNNATAIEGVKPSPTDGIRAHFTAGVTGNYAQALGIPLIEGRFLEEADNQRKPLMCVVDADFAKRYWPGQSAIGHRIANGPEFKEENAHTIVGVVGSVKQNDLADKSGQGAIYYPYVSYASSDFSVVIRTAMEPTLLAPVLQKTVLKLDPELPVDELKPMQVLVDDSLVSRKSPALLAGIFAGVALLLAAVGTYGVLAYAVSQRRREIGVRMALGAQPAQVLGQFLGLGLKLLLIGIVLGVAGAWGVGIAMQSVLVGVGAVHVGVLAATAGVLLVVVLLATFLPSHRASRVSPMEALRND
ncbi:ABC transporter permease [Oleiharenicola lentus]|uniref:ABC transporter permease n=1 Tax=Oleiharenicola lentus TaxID=2508720 RepID=UPI003F68011D